MTYFDCFTLAAWMFAAGWFLGAIYVQDQNENTESPRVAVGPEPSPDCEAWRLPVTA